MHGHDAPQVRLAQPRHRRQGGEAARRQRQVDGPPRGATAASSCGATTDAIPPRVVAVLKEGDGPAAAAERHGGEAAGKAGPNDNGAAGHATWGGRGGEGRHPAQGGRRHGGVG